MNPLATGLVLCSSYGQNVIEVTHPLPVSQLEGLTTSTAWCPPCTPFPGLTRGLVTPGSSDGSILVECNGNPRSFIFW